jgi:hypothetical protein
MSDGLQVGARILGSISELPRAAWQQLLGGVIYDYDYLRACELAAPDEFSFLAAAAFDGAKLIAAMPLFRVTFRTEMALAGSLKQGVRALGAVWPRFVNMPLMGAGSPYAARLPLAFAPGMEAADRQEALRGMVQAMAIHARASNIDLMAIKDVREEEAAWCHELLIKEGFVRTSSLPIAVLEVPFASEQDYMASLSPGIRRGLRRNLKRTQALRFELRDAIDDVEMQIVELARSTRRQAKATYDMFDKVPPSFVRTVLANMRERARVLLVWLGSELIGFCFVLMSDQALEPLCTGMRYPVAREHRVYFAIWMYLVRMCVERRTARLVAGQSGAFTKVRLGCKLERDWIYFRYRRPVLNCLLQLLGPRIGFDKLDPDLIKLGAGAPYMSPRAATAPTIAS